MTVAPDETEAIAGGYKLLSNPNRRPLQLKLAGLDPAANYEVSLWEDGGFAEEDKKFNCGRRGGDELMRGGLLLD
jgi:hypothetical protein